MGLDGNKCVSRHSRVNETRVEMTTDTPLVTIGIPTYNRAALLARAVESAISQDYPRLEIIISDNASADSTQAVCADFAHRDSRVKCIRRESNSKVTANFLSVLTQARGELFMWLADDDWLDRSYVSRCARILIDNPDFALAFGRGKYYENGIFRFVAVETSFTAGSPSARVVSFYRQVVYNTAFYGLMRREVASVIPLREVLAADWFFVSGAAYLGKIAVVDDVCIHRSVHGASKDLREVALKLGLGKVAASDPHLVIAATVCKDIAWRSPTYRPLGVAARLILGVQAFWAVFSRYCMPAYSRRLQKFLDYTYAVWRGTYAVWRAFQRFLERYVIWRFRRQR
jgi:glycosyltransferase involved in cell wall biosynthesis